MTVPSFVTVPDGVRIAYHQVGGGDPSIVFVHGIYGSRKGFGFRRSTSRPATAAWPWICEVTATATSQDEGLFDGRVRR